MRSFISIGAPALAAATALFGSSVAAHAVTIYAIDHLTTNTLFSIDSAAPSTILTGTPVLGLQSGESLVAIDFRTNGVLYGVGSSSRVYTINTTTGAATAVGGAFTPALNGVNFDMDFNPVVDLIRVVGDADQNLRVSPVTGAVTNVDTPLNYTGALTGVNPNVAGIAYSNNRAGAATTTLYGIDSGTDTLNVIAPPNAGTMTLQGPLGVDVTAVLGFDIATSSGGTNTAFAALQTTSSSFSELHSINLTTGAATLIGAFGGGFVVRDIAVVPEPAGVAIAGLFTIGFAARRRKA